MEVRFENARCYLWSTKLWEAYVPAVFDKQLKDVIMTHFISILLSKTERIWIPSRSQTEGLNINVVRLDEFVGL